MTSWSCADRFARKGHIDVRLKPALGVPHGIADSAAAPHGTQHFHRHKPVQHQVGGTPDLAIPPRPRGRPVDIGPRAAIPAMAGQGSLGTIIAVTTRLGRIDHRRGKPRGNLYATGGSRDDRA